MHTAPYSVAFACDTKPRDMFALLLCRDDACSAFFVAFVDPVGLCGRELRSRRNYVITTKQM